MKYLILGLGSIGVRHMRNLAAIDRQAEFFVCSKSSAVQELKKQYAISVFQDIEHALKHKPDACLICNPTSLHIPTAEKLVGKCRSIFIEKPLSNSMDGVDELIAKAQKAKCKVLIGYNLRWHPVVRKVREIISSGELGRIHFARMEVGQYLPDWRIKDYAKTYSSKKSMGGGVILDLSHEIDYAYWYFGMPQEVRGFSKKVSNLKIDTEDVAEITMKYKSMICQVHLDYLRRDPKRIMDIVGEKGALYADILSAHISMKDSLINLGPYDSNQMYIEEMKHLIECIENKAKPEITIKEARDVLDICLKAKAQ